MKEYKVIVDSEGIIHWLNKEGHYHCEHGPAMIYPSGRKEYWRNDRLHREDGPAVEYPDGTKYYFIKGKELTEEAFFAFSSNGGDGGSGHTITLEEFKELTVKEIEDLLGYPVKIVKG